MQSVEDCRFYSEAIKNIHSEDPLASFRDFFHFLQKHMSLQGMVIHHFSPKYTALLNLFFIDANGMHYLKTHIDLSSKDMLFIRAFHLAGGINHVADCRKSGIATIMIEMLSKYIDAEGCPHLVCALNTSQGSIGSIRLIGTKDHVFTLEQQNIMKMFAIPLGVTLQKLLWTDYVDKFVKEVRDSHEEIVEDTPRTYSKLIGVESGLKSVMEIIRKLVVTEAPVLLLGETGTGKDLLASAIKENSIRKDKPYVAVNCGAIAESLMDSVLFGHEKGSFTGAYSAVPGKFELANTGTLFLDEIGELTLQAQVRLLRTLQNHVVERVGSTEPIPINVRIIAATNRNIEQMVQDGLFREDLYHRLNVFTIHVPPLRERLDDIIPLAQYFLKAIAKRMGLPHVAGIHPSSTEKLFDYPWPGNVRELENLITRALVLNYDKKIKLDEFLPQQHRHCLKSQVDSTFRQNVEAIIEDYLYKSGCEQPKDRGAYTHPEPIEEFSGDTQLSEGGERGSLSSSKKLDTLDEAMKKHILKALQITNGKVHGPSGAGELLNINPDTLRKRMIKLGISGGKTV